MPAVLPLLLAAAEGKGGSITDVDFVLTISTFVLFLIFAFVLGKFGWGPLLAMIEEREKNVRDAVEGAQKASTEAAALLDQHKQLIRDAGRERDDIMKKAIAEAEQIKSDLTEKARAEGDQLIKRAKEQIEREKAQAIVELRAQVADIAVEAASKIVVSSMTPEAQKKLVGDFITQLPKSPS
jgi:F-type H+-transporting ATPase subunit b